MKYLEYTEGDYIEWVGPCEVSIDGVPTGKWIIPSKDQYNWSGDPVDPIYDYMYLGRDLNALESPDVWDINDTNMYYDSEKDGLETCVKYLDQFKGSLTNGSVQSLPLFDD